MTTNLPPPDTSLRALAKLAGPIFVANIAIIGGGTIDTIMAGHLGTEHLAAIALGLAATICVNMAGIGVLQGLSPIAGHHFGARQYRQIGETLQQNFWLAIALSCIGVPLLLSTDMWTHFGGVTGEVARMAAGYLVFTALSQPFAFFARSFISLNAALSRPKVTMWISLITLALKAPVNAIFMYGWFGLPAMGGIGAGVSFALMNVISFLLFWALWRFDPFYEKFRATQFNWPKWSMIKEQLHIGLPIGLSTFFEVSSFTGMAILVSRLGAETISAHQIMTNITTLCYMLPLSLGIASSVLVSQSLGARWESIAYHALKRSLRVALALSLLLVTSLYFARGFIVSLYTKDPEVISLCSALLIFGCCYHLFDALQSVSAFALRGYRVTKLPMVIFGIMLWGVGFCGGYYLCFHGESVGGPYGVFGFWSATATGLTLTGICLVSMALYVGRHRAHADEHSADEIQNEIAKSNQGLLGSVL